MTHGMHFAHTGEPNVFRSTQLAKPHPGPGEILVRNRSAAVNFIDTIIRRGEMPPGMMPDLPHIPGVEGAGLVEELGAGVNGFAIGDPVAWIGPIGAGGYATHTVVGAPYAARLPSGCDLSRAAALPVNAMTAWHMLVNLGRASAGDSVLIHAAAGGVGTMAVQIARHLGLHVIASTSTAKVGFVRELGAEDVIDYRLDGTAEPVMSLTKGRGVDLTLNPIGGDTLTSDLGLLAPLGTAVLFGFLAGPPTGNFAEDLAAHFQKSVSVQVSDIYTFFREDPVGFNRDLVTVFDLFAKGILKPTITTFPLSEAPEAHRRLESGETIGKLVLTVA